MVDDDRSAGATDPAGAGYGSYWDNYDDEDEFRRPLGFGVRGHSPVRGIIMDPDDPAAILVLGHGAGAPITHHFMEALCVALAGQGIVTMRYNYHFADAGRRRPDPQRRLLATTASALCHGRLLKRRLPLFAGGKSMGGRMTSTLLADGPPDGADEPPQPLGVVFFGFPLHPPGRPGTERAEHLARVPCPMLFHQGARDRLADLDLLRPVIADLGEAATLNVIEGGDHSLKVLKRLGRAEEEVLADVALVTRRWMDKVIAAQPPAPPRLPYRHGPIYGPLPVTPAAP